MYISGTGALRERRPCGLWVIPALLWSILNLIGLFILTMAPCLHYNKEKRKVNTLK